MLKNLLSLFLISLTLVTVYVIYVKLNAPLNIQHEFVKPPKQSPAGELSSESIAILETINKRNALIKNFSCTNAKFTVSSDGSKYNLTGTFYFEANRKLNMRVNSWVGEEFFMGSNDVEFWFWSKRMQPAVLHFAKYRDYSKTRLKSVFNPTVVIESLGFQILNFQKPVTVVDVGEKLCLMEPMVDTLGATIVKMTFVKKNTYKIIGQIISDTNGKAIASSEILAWNGELPKQILYNWHEEKRVMVLDMAEAKTNTQMNEKFWLRPNLRNAIDMGKE